MIASSRVGVFWISNDLADIARTSEDFFKLELLDFFCDGIGNLFLLIRDGSFKVSFWVSGSLTN